jgi:cytochrome c oxidase subunit I
MSASAQPHVSAAPAHGAAEPENYLNARKTILSWLLTVDHKRIGIMYLYAIVFFFFLGAVAAALFRIDLMLPGDVAESPLMGKLLRHETYNKLFTMHGIMMIFFFLVPSIPAVLGNFFLPLQLGAKDVAFPRLNLASWYIFMVGASFTVIAMVLGGVDTGWTFYTPYSSVYANGNVMMVGLGVFITGFSSILTGLNFVVTVHKMRAPGLTWFRLPLFVWAQYATSLIMLLGTPLVAITVLLVALERAFGIAIFDPRQGGDPVLFQHMFWFYSHPAVYIMILPGFGVISDVIACFTRNKIVGYKFVAISSLAIAAIGFFVWGHHMYTSGQSHLAGIVFSALTMLVGIPTAIKVFNWTATLYKGSVSLASPMIYALGMIGLFIIGGMTGLYLATTALDIHLHDTYFVVAHFHYVMVGGMVMSWLCGIHFWWPKMFGRLYNETAAKIAAWLIFVGFNATFFPQFIMGYMGMPRRYHTYAQEFQLYHVASTLGAAVMAFGLILCFINLARSIKKGPKSPVNPWCATGLEWNNTQSPPIEHNFAEDPVVDVDVYDYTDERVYQKSTL